MICFDEDVALLQNTIVGIKPKSENLIQTERQEGVSTCIEEIIKDLIANYDKQDKIFRCQKLCVLLFCRAAATDFNEYWLFPGVETLILKIPPFNFTFFFGLVNRYAWKDLLLKILEYLPSNISSIILNDHIIPFCLNEDHTNDLISVPLQFLLKHSDFTLNLNKTNAYSTDDVSLDIESKCLNWDNREILKKYDLMKSVDQELVFRTCLSSLNDALEKLIKSSPSVPVLNQDTYQVARKITHSLQMEDLDCIFAKFCPQPKENKIHIGEPVPLSNILLFIHDIVQKQSQNNYKFIYFESSRCLDLLKLSKNSNLFEKFDEVGHQCITKLNSFLLKVADEQINSETNEQKLSLIDIIDKRSSGYLDAVNELIKNKDIFNDSSLLECLQRNSNLLHYYHFLCLVDQVSRNLEAPRKEYLIQILLSVYNRQPLSLQQSLLIRVLNKYGCQTILLSQKFPSQVIALFNKVIQNKPQEDIQILKIVLNLGLQSILDILQRCVEESLIKSAQIPILAKILQGLGRACQFLHPVSQQPIIIHVIYKIMINSEYGDSSWQNLLSLLQLLSQRYKDTFDLEKSFDEPAILNPDLLMEICILPHLIPSDNLEQEFLTQRALSILSTQLTNKNLNWFKSFEPAVLVFSLCQILDHCEFTPNKVILRQYTLKTLTKIITAIKKNKNLQDAESLSWLHHKLLQMHCTIPLYISDLFKNGQLQDFLSQQFAKHAQGGWYQKIIASLQAVAISDEISNFIGDNFLSILKQKNDRESYMGLTLALTQVISFWNGDELQRVINMILRAIENNDFTKLLANSVQEPVVVVCILFENIVRSLLYFCTDFVAWTDLVQNMVKTIKNYHDLSKQMTGSISWISELFCRLCNLLSLIPPTEGETIFIFLLELQGFLQPVSLLKNNPSLHCKLVKECSKIPILQQRDLIIKYFLPQD